MPHNPQVMKLIKNTGYETDEASSARQCSRSAALSLTHKHTHTLSLSLSRSLSHAHTQTHTHTRSLSHTHKHTHTLPRSLSHPHKRTHTQTFSLLVRRPANPGVEGYEPYMTSTSWTRKVDIRLPGTRNSRHGRDICAPTGYEADRSQPLDDYLSLSRARSLSPALSLSLTHTHTLSLPVGLQRVPQVRRKP